MSADHQVCDGKFALAEQAAYSNNWRESETAFNSLLKFSIAAEKQ